MKKWHLPNHKKPTGCHQHVHLFNLCKHNTNMFICSTSASKTPIVRLLFFFKVSKNYTLVKLPHDVTWVTPTSTLKPHKLGCMLKILLTIDKLVVVVGVFITNISENMEH